MASLNQVLIIGNLTRDPETRQTTGGHTVGELRLAVNSRYKDKEEVCYVGVTVWGKTAEACGKYLSKGASVFVEGRLQYQEWEKDGQKRNKLIVVAGNVQFLDGRGGKQDDGGQRGGDAGGSPDDNLPF